MDMYNSDKTISLWENSTRKSVTLMNRKTGERYSFVLKQYDKQNNVILETQPISFAIIPPNNHQWDCII